MSLLDAGARLTLHAWRRPHRIVVTRHRATGEWIVSAYGLGSVRYGSWFEAIFAADGMAWAVRCHLRRLELIAAGL